MPQGTASSVFNLKSMQHIIHFIKYHNAFTIIFVIAFIATTSAFASEDVRNAVIGEEIVTMHGVNNSVIREVNLDNFDMQLYIQSVSENDEYYYVEYSFQTLAIVENEWREVTKEQTLKILKVDIGERDVGLSITEELSEVVDREFAYLKEAQEDERTKGVQRLTASLEYTGLVGLALDLKNKVLSGEDLQEKPQLFGDFNPVQLFERQTSEEEEEQKEPESQPNLPAGETGADQPAETPTPTPTPEPTPVPELTPEATLEPAPEPTLSPQELVWVLELLRAWEMASLLE